MTSAMYSNVSEWINAGNMKSGFYLLEKVERETEKAIGFKAEKYNSYGNLKPATCWMPKSKVQAIVNDFYTALDAPATMYLVPDWLYNTKTAEGFVI